MKKLFVLLLAISIAMSVFSIMSFADEELAPTITAKGVSIRIPNEQSSIEGGLRFKMRVDKPIPDGVEITKQGTLIIPRHTIGDAELTLDTHNVLNVEKTKNKYYSYEDTYYEFTAVLTEIPVKHFKSDICARGYITYSVNGGEEKTIYTDTVTYDIYSIAEEMVASETENAENKAAVKEFVIDEYDNYYVDLADLIEKTTITTGENVGDTALYTTPDSVGYGNWVKINMLADPVDAGNQHIMAFIGNYGIQLSASGTLHFATYNPLVGVVAEAAASTTTFTGTIASNDLIKTSSDGLCKYDVYLKVNPVADTTNVEISYKLIDRSTGAERGSCTYTMTGKRFSSGIEELTGTHVTFRIKRNATANGTKGLTINGNKAPGTSDGEESGSTGIVDLAALIEKTTITTGENVGDTALYTTPDSVGYGNWVKINMLPDPVAGGNQHIMAFIGNYGIQLSHGTDLYFGTYNPLVGVVNENVSIAKKANGEVTGTIASNDLKTSHTDGLCKYDVYLKVDTVNATDVKVSYMLIDRTTGTERGSCTYTMTGKRFSSEIETATGTPVTFRIKRNSATGGTKGLTINGKAAESSN